MTLDYTPSEKTQNAINLFDRYDVDTKLALLWFGYLDIKDELKPDPAPSADKSGHAVYDRIKDLSPEQQLQAQRDILSGSGEYGKNYDALSSSARIEVWLLLGQGMESGDIIQVPSDYKLPEQTHEFSDLISQLSFEERIDFMRTAVRQSMGTAAKQS